MNSIRLLMVGLLLIPLIPVYLVAGICDIIICLVVLILDLTSRYRPDEVLLIPKLNRAIQGLAA